jgi:hypothetical protein
MAVVALKGAVRPGVGGRERKSGLRKRGWTLESRLKRNPEIV